MNHHTAAVGVIIAMLITIAYVLDPGPYAAFAFAFVALPLLAFVIVFYYLREMIRELRHRDVL